MTRPTIIHLSAENLIHNLGVIKKKASRSKIIAMVKANAYGHGLCAVSQKLDPYVDIIGVASIDEALCLRRAGVKSEILLIEGVFEPSEFTIASSENFSVVFHNTTQIHWLSETNFISPISAWIKFDTGMGRLGFGQDQIYSVFNEVASSSKVKKPIGLMSHFACAEEDNPLNTEQSNLFRKVITQLKNIKELKIEISLCNSAGIFNFPSDHYDYVRPGLALYGVSPFRNISAADLDLKPVMSFCSKLISVKKLLRGSCVGYGMHYTCPEDMLVGIVACGYGDGYPRSARNNTPVLVNGIICNLIGRVSMDMLAVDLRSCKNAKIGDDVMLWGHKYTNALPVEMVSDHTSNIVYDTLTGIQHRVRSSRI